MSNQISFDVYATMEDPHFRVDHQVVDGCVQVTFGGPPAAYEQRNMLNLWFKDPSAVLDLGKELMAAGLSLQTQQERVCPE